MVDGGDAVEVMIRICNDIDDSAGGMAELGPYTRCDDLKLGDGVLI